MLATSAWCMFLVALHFTPLKNRLTPHDWWSAWFLAVIGIILAIWWDMRQP